MRKPTKQAPVDYGLALLLDYDGRVLHLPGGYWMKFVIHRQQASGARPHGLSYSFTLHDASNHRVLGFDNAHAVKPHGRNAKPPATHDHWHRSSDDAGQPYTFTDAATLVQDFFDAVEKHLTNHGHALDVIGEGTVDSTLTRQGGKAS